MYNSSNGTLEQPLHGEKIEGLFCSKVRRKNLKFVNDSFSLDYADKAWWMK